jgi:hypothetical protein
MLLVVEFEVGIGIVAIVGILIVAVVVVVDIVEVEIGIVAVVVVGLEKQFVMEVDLVDEEVEGTYQFLV